MGEPPWRSTQLARSILSRSHLNIKQETIVSLQMLSLNKLLNWHLFSSSPNLKLRLSKRLSKASTIIKRKDDNRWSQRQTLDLRSRWVSISLELPICLGCRSAKNRLLCKTRLGVIDTSCSRRISRCTFQITSNLCTAVSLTWRH